MTFQQRSSSHNAIFYLECVFSSNTKQRFKFLFLASISEDEGIVCCYRLTEMRWNKFYGTKSWQKSEGTRCVLIHKDKNKTESFVFYYLAIENRRNTCILQVLETNASSFYRMTEITRFTEHVECYTRRQKKTEPL